MSVAWDTTTKHKLEAVEVGVFVEMAVTKYSTCWGNRSRHGSDWTDCD